MEWPDHTITRNNVHIVDSYKVSKEDFAEVLDYIYENDRLVSMVFCRSRKSLCREWAVHNFLHDLGILQERTKDVDLNCPQKWYVSLAYWLMGWCKHFVK